jgi:hypothetical protein
MIKSLDGEVVLDNPSGIRLALRICNLFEDNIVGL